MIILGTGAIGKTTLGQKYKNCVDLESSDFQWIYSCDFADPEARKAQPNLRRPNPEWPENYLRALMNFENQGKVVLAGIFPEVLSFLRENQIDFYGVVVDKNLKSELFQRSLGRGNNLDFANRLMESFAEHNRRAETAPKQIRLSSGCPNLEVALTKMGIELEK